MKTLFLLTFVMWLACLVSGCGTTQAVSDKLRFTEGGFSWDGTKDKTIGGITIMTPSGTVLTVSNYTSTASAVALQSAVAEQARWADLMQFIAQKGSDNFRGGGSGGGYSIPPGFALVPLPVTAAPAAIVTNSAPAQTASATNAPTK